jgi:polysaccharide export outer membrane protein
MHTEERSSFTGTGIMKKTIVLTGLALFGLWFLTGCYNDPLDPTQIGRFEPTPAVNVILDTLGVADEPSPTYEGAEPPRPEDLVEFETDYVFGPGDIVRISIYELYQEGQTYVNDYVVTETGRISIPDVGLVHAAGLTEPELEQEIRNILSPMILKNPSVTATLLQSQSRVFSIVGQGVGQSARFSIPRYTFRLTDAIALAGGVAEFNVSYIYVSRDVNANEAQAYPTAELPAQTSQPMLDKREIPMTPVEPGAGKEEPAISPEEEMLEIIAPADMALTGLVIGSSEAAKRRELERLAAPEDIADTEPSGFSTSFQTQPVLRLADTPQQIEWVFEDGKWRPKTPAEAEESTPAEIRPEDLQTDTPSATPSRPRNNGLSDVGQAGKVTRVIQIPVDRLLAGDPKYNIIIRPGDRITVPVDLIGEFWVMGNVNAQGAIPITGRPITLKQAIATAGGLGPLAWPKKAEVVRRIGRNNAGLMQEETVLVDLQKIARGQQPDFFIKPNDLINVGTHGTSRWQAVLRNAFRATYGFGFIYDRNFADRHYYTTIPEMLHF